MKRDAKIMSDGISIKKIGSFWIELINIKYQTDIRPDGFFVAFIRKNIENTEIDNQAFIDRLRTFIKNHNIPHIRVSLPYYDRVIVYTSCDKNEITRIYSLILKDIPVKEKNLLWKAAFESDDAWEQNQWLYLLNCIFSTYEKKAAKLALNRNKSLALLKSQTYQRILEDEIMTRDSMVIKPVFGAITKYSVNPRTVFVLMPFNEDWSEHTYHLIKKAGEIASITVNRADDFFQPDIIIEDIWKNINYSSLILADISVHNANVFYELGIAHTLGKQVIMIKQKNDMPAPFDIKAWRYLEYELNPKPADVFVERLSKLFSAHIEST